MRKFQIWKKITLGAYKSTESYRKALTEAGFCIDRAADGILDKIRISQNLVRLDLVIQSVGDLGFNDAALLSEIYTKGKDLGLQLCPSEVGPALRLAYLNQPSWEWLWIAMESIIDWSIRSWIFGVVNRDDDLWLDSSNDDPGHLWLPDSHFIFIPRHK